MEKKKQNNKKVKGCLITLWVFLLLLLIAIIIPSSNESEEIDNTYIDHSKIGNSSSGSQSQVINYSKICPKAGLGDTMEFFDTVLSNDSYTKESYKDRINYTNSSTYPTYTISYEKKLRNFGNPERIGEIHGSFDEQNSVESSLFFADHIKRFIPKDSKIIRSFRKDKIKVMNEYLDEQTDIYVLKSKSLAKIAEIKNAYYQKLKKSDIGTFIIIVHYLSGSDFNKVSNYCIAIAIPRESELLGSKHIRNNHFK